MSERATQSPVTRRARRERHTPRGCAAQGAPSACVPPAGARPLGPSPSLSILTAGPCSQAPAWRARKSVQCGLSPPRRPAQERRAVATHSDPSRSLVTRRPAGPPRPLPRTPPLHHQPRPGLRSLPGRRARADGGQEAAMRGRDIQARPASSLTPLFFSSLSLTQAFHKRTPPSLSPLQSCSSASPPSCWLSLVLPPPPSACASPCACPRARAGRCRPSRRAWPRAS